MRFAVPIALGVLVATFVVLKLPVTLWTAAAWAGICTTVLLSVVDVLVWQTVKGLDDYATRFVGPSHALEIVLARVWDRKRRMVGLFSLNFAGRAYCATIFGAVTAGKIQAARHPFFFSAAFGIAAFSIPVLLQQLVSYFKIGKELSGQILSARKDTERTDELKRAAERPSPSESDEHTASYTKVIPWNVPKSAKRPK